MCGVSALLESAANALGEQTNTLIKRTDKNFIDTT
jgi:hypothetical protein